MLSRVLIIDKRKELSVKYKKAIDDEQTTAVIAGNMKQAFDEVQHSEPDLIIVSDSISEPLTDFCEKIRALTYDTRPVIVALSKSAEMSDKINTLNSGADDFWSEPVNIDEFKTRIRAHLRREIESNLDDKTLLPNIKITRKSLKRLLAAGNDKAVLLISIENLNDYRSVYSDIAGDKLVQAFVAIVKSAAEPNDYFGHINDDDFILITAPVRAEKFSAYLTFAFDTVVTKFYSEEDAKRGYMLIKGDRLAGMRVNFVSLQIGGILGHYDLIRTADILLDQLYTLKKAAKIPSGSNYIIDRVKLTGGESEWEDTTNGKVYIKESDSSLALLLRTTLELQGYDVTETLDFESVKQPSILILDSGDNFEELEFCKKIKTNNNFVNSKVIVTSTVHDKTSILNAGADLYLPKPYELTDLIQWVEFFYKK